MDANSTIALSTAESELQAILDGAVGSLGLEAMLLVEPATKVIASDSTSALAIGAGTGSWRTRHLRLKSAWIQDMLSSGEIQLKTSTRFIPAGGPVDQGPECSEDPSSTRPVGGGGAKEWKATKSILFVRNCNKGVGGCAVF